MLHETASSLSPRTVPPPALPPSLHLTSPQENDDSFNHSGGSKFTMKIFRWAFHHIVFLRRSGTVGRLERVAEATVGDKNMVCSSSSSSSLRCRMASCPASPPSTTSIIPQSIASHISTPQHSPTTLITPFPSLDISDLSSRGLKNNSSFSNVLLAREDGEHEGDDPALALWYSEQLHRARLAKLTRHLGEEIPAGMVLSPALLSCGTSHPHVRSHRGGYHHKRRSLDPLAFIQETSVTVSSAGVLRRSKSLKVQGDTHPTSLVIGTTPKPPSTRYITNVIRSTEAMPNTITVLDSPPPITASDAHLNPSMTIPNGDVPRERASMDTYSDSLSRSSHLSAEISNETSPFSLRPNKIRSLPRRPATADASQRVEKLANFFGVCHEDVSALAHGTSQKHRFASTGVAGDPATGDHAPHPQLEVEVKFNKPTRFWNGRAMAKSVHPDDVMDKLRMMRAS